MIWLQLTSSTHSYIIPQYEQYIQGRLLTYWPMNTICSFTIPKCPPTAAAAKRAVHNYSLCHTLSFKCFMWVNLFLKTTLKRRSYYCFHFNKKQKKNEGREKKFSQDDTANKWHSQKIRTHQSPSHGYSLSYITLRFTFLGGFNRMI